LPWQASLISLVFFSHGKPLSKNTKALSKTNLLPERNYSFDRRLSTVDLYLAYTG